MKHKIVKIIILLIFSVSVISIYTGIVSGESNKSEKDERIVLENAIIVRSLRMNDRITDEKRNEDIEDIIDDHESSWEGKIIYDNSFKDTIIQGEKTERKILKKNRNSKIGKKASRKNISLIDSLRKRDKRWHLTKYKIRKRDNLWKIAMKFGVSHRIIIRANKIKDPDRLLPGNYINVPNRIGLYYTIKKGDTLKKISKRFRVKTSEIISNNRLGKSRLIAGNKIFIPGAAGTFKRKKSAVKKVKMKGLTAKRKIKFIWPIRGKLTSGFGTRKDPLSGKRQFHCGIDISSNVGRKIKASASGTIIFSGWKRGYGNVVIIRHKFGYITVYAHNSKNLLKANDNVKAGDIIALTGMTGAVTGAHLHFEIRKYVTPLNPLRLLR